MTTTRTKKRKSSGDDQLSSSQSSSSSLVLSADGNDDDGTSSSTPTATHEDITISCGTSSSTSNAVDRLASSSSANVSSSSSKRTKDGTKTKKKQRPSSTQPHSQQHSFFSSSSNFLNQLKQLRGFVGDSSEFTEQDLSNCLRSCNYNVHTAAEQILTNQWKKTATTPVSSSSSPSITSTSVHTTATTITTTSERTEEIVIDDDDANNNEDGLADVTVEESKKEKFSSTRKKKQTEMVVVTPATVSTKKKRTQQNINSSTSTPSSLKKEEENQSKQQQQQCCHQSPNSSSANTPSSSTENEMQTRQSVHPNFQMLLLTKRWIGNAYSTSRHGTIQHNEHLMISTTVASGGASTTAPPIVRFHNHNRTAEGTLPKHLGHFLAPLMRQVVVDEPQTTNKKKKNTTFMLNNRNNNSSSSSSLIHVEGRAIMGDDHLYIGCEVPLELSVYIRDPCAFFDLFTKEQEGAQSSSSSFFQKKSKASSKKYDTPLSVAAFQLLQWAQYGDQLPVFTSLSSSSSSNTQNNAKNDSTNNMANDNDDGDEDDVDATEEEVILNESDFQVQNDDDDDNDNEKQEKKQNLLSSGTDDDDNMYRHLPEMEDPKGLKSHIELRSYQRQALYWMIQREQPPTNQTTGSAELDLLMELTSHQQQQSNKGSCDTRGSYVEDDMEVWTGGGTSSTNENEGSLTNGGVVQCDRGPVKISKDMDRDGNDQIMTLDGHCNPPIHPLWSKRYLMVMMDENKNDDERENDNEKPDRTSALVVVFYVNELFRVARSTPPPPPQPCRGGILADSMGLGKTVMLLSLICQSKANDEQRRQDDDDNNKEEDDPQHASSNKRTLVITPLSLLDQWKEELLDKTTNLTHLVYYGESMKRRQSTVTLEGVDVVLTTYGTIQGEYLGRLRKNRNSSSGNGIFYGGGGGLIDVPWERIILDEAHGIKNTSTAISRACCLLKAPKRWCVTGTPIQNSLGDVYGLLKFLKHEPWCDATFWKRMITNVMNQNQNNTSKNEQTSTMEGDGFRTALERVKRLLMPMMIRRTKKSLDRYGNPILTLPPMEMKIVKVEFSMEERFFYNALLDKSLTVFEGFIRSGTASKSWLAIFSLLQRLRQACDHVALTVKTSLEEQTSNNEHHVFNKKGRFSSHGNSTSSTTGEDGVKTDEQEEDTAGTNTNGTTLDESKAMNIVKESVSDEFLRGLLQKFQQPSASSNNTNVTTTNNKHDDDSETSDTVNHGNTTYLTQRAKELYETCCGGVVDDDTSNDNLERNHNKLLEEECPICFECPQLGTAVLTPCAHMFCETCLVDFLNNHNQSNNKKNDTKGKKCTDGPCPTCNEHVLASRIIALRRHHETGQATTTFLTNTSPFQKRKPISTNKKKEGIVGTNSDAARRTLEAGLSGTMTSAKIQAVLNELNEIWKLDPGSKVIMFSQFLGCLDLLEIALLQEQQQTNSSNSFFVGRLDGKMSMQQRVQILDDFKKSSSSSSETTTTTPMDESMTNGKGDDCIKRGSVLLVSMKAGGVGINLVAASTVFIIDPWWNAAIEDQCINRIHRIGQKANLVRVRKFVVTDSVEEKMVKLQHKKQDMATEILNDNSTNATTTTSNANPTLEDFKELFQR